MRPLFLFVVVMTILCSGCTPIISEQARKLVDTDTDFHKIRTTPETYIGKHLLIGGRIATVSNSQYGGQLEIVQFDLDYTGAPLSSYRSYGRFLATATEYLEPLIYRQGMLVTLVGEVKGKQTNRLDNMDYVYPVIAMREWHLWPNSELNANCLYLSPSLSYDPYSFGYGCEPFLPRPFSPLRLPR